MIDPNFFEYLHSISLSYSNLHAEEIQLSLDSKSIKKRGLDASICSIKTLIVASELEKNKSLHETNKDLREKFSNLYVTIIKTSSIQENYCVKRILKAILTVWPTPFSTCNILSEIYQEILSHLPMKDTQHMAIINKSFNQTTTNTIRDQQFISLQNFLRFLEKNLKDISYITRIKSLPSIAVFGKKIKENLSLVQINFYLYEIREDIFNVLYSLPTKEFKELKKVLKNQKMSTFFQEIFKAKRIYKAVSQFLNKEEKYGHLILANQGYTMVDILFKEKHFKKIIELINHFSNKKSETFVRLFKSFVELGNLKRGLELLHTLDEEFKVNFCSDICNILISNKHYDQAYKITNEIKDSYKRNGQFLDVSRNIFTLHEDTDWAFKFALGSLPSHDRDSALTRISRLVGVQKNYGKALEIINKMFLDYNIKEEIINLFKSLVHNNDKSIQLIFDRFFELVKLLKDDRKMIALNSLIDTLTESKRKIQKLTEETTFDLVFLLIANNRFDLVLSLENLFEMGESHREFCQNIILQLMTNNSSEIHPEVELSLLFTACSNYEFLPLKQITNKDVKFYQKWLSSGKDDRKNYKKFCWLVKVAVHEQGNNAIEFLSKVLSFPFEISTEKMKKVEYDLFVETIKKSLAARNYSLVTALLSFGQHDDKIILIKKHWETISSFPLSLLLNLFVANPQIKEFCLPVLNQHSDLSSKVIEWFEQQPKERIIEAMHVLTELVKEEATISHSLNKKSAVICDRFKNKPSLCISKAIVKTLYILLEQNNFLIYSLPQEALHNISSHKSHQILDTISAKTLSQIVIRCDEEQKKSWFHEIEVAEQKMHIKFLRIILDNCISKKTFELHYQKCYSEDYPTTNYFIEHLSDISILEDYQKYVLKILMYMQPSKTEPTINMRDMLNFCSFLLQDSRCDDLIALKKMDFQVEIQGESKIMANHLDSKFGSRVSILSVINYVINDWISPVLQRPSDKIVISKEYKTRNLSLEGTKEYVKFLMKIEKEQNEQASIELMIQEFMQDTGLKRNEITNDMIAQLKDSYKEQLIEAKRLQMQSLYENDLKTQQEKKEKIEDNSVIDTDYFMYDSQDEIYDLPSEEDVDDVADDIDQSE